MKLKIQSDGTPDGAKVLDRESGQEIQVAAIKWEIRVGEPAACWLKAPGHLVDIDVEGELCPNVFKIGGSPGEAARELVHLAPSEYRLSLKALRQDQLKGSLYAPARDAFRVDVA